MPTLDFATPGSEKYKEITMENVPALIAAAIAAVITGFVVVRKAGDNCTP